MRKADVLKAIAENVSNGIFRPHKRTGQILCRRDKCDICPFHLRESVIEYSCEWFKKKKKFNLQWFKENYPELYL